MKNNDQVLYVIDANVVPGDGSELLEQVPEAKKAFLKGFVKANDALEAGNKLKESLERDHYTAIKIIEILLEGSYEEDDWDDDVKDIIDEAKKDKDSEVYYGSFYCYTDEDDV